MQAFLFSLFLWPLAPWTAAVQGQAATYKYQSRPDLNPVALLVTQPPSASYNAGFYLTCPRGSSVPQSGPAIYSSNGELVWSGAELGQCFDLQTQNLNGTEVITLWVGDALNGGGHGEDGRALILNSTYDVIFNLTARAPAGTDFHEFNIPVVTNSTALLSAYFPVQADLTSVGGPKDGWIYECQFEELDIASGEVLFTWNASTHVDFADSYLPPGPGITQENAWDFFHLNAVDKDSEGNYLANSRHYHSAYKISGKTGEVLWTLGGKNSTFEIGDDAHFAWQHFARWVVEGSLLSLFDNESNGTVIEAPNARGLILDIDTSTMRASARNEYLPPINLTSGSQGSMRLQSDQNVLVGWGSNPWITEYNVDGTRIYAAALGGENLTNGPVQNYRAFKTTTWRGFPQTWPDMHLNGTTIYASWNGATEVAMWEVFVGESADALTSAQNSTRTGFETTLILDDAPTFARVRAYDAQGALLGASATQASNGTVAGDGYVVRSV